MKNFCVLLSAIVLIQCAPGKQTWTLVGENTQSTIFVSDRAGEPVQLAVADMVNDIEKITGMKLNVVHHRNKTGKNPMIIGNLASVDDRKMITAINQELDTLAGKWESYVISIADDQQDKPLLITGSDERGTMFAIYKFVEKYLEVDPLYYWTGIEPEKRKTLEFENIELSQEEPDFKYRGWFINDEDLLTEFVNDAGNRDIDYPFYKQVVHPEVIGHVMEALVRSGYNLTIPASFIDIMNPPERKLVEEAAKRGIFISQHHIEPVGVSAFSFFNYWKERGAEHRFSFYSSRPQLEEVWEKYIAEWAEFPNVIWQIGLRGIADRPMWMADPEVPQSDADRGALISEAMRTQMDLIRQYDDRKNPPVTTTLWAEGAALNQAGHLKFPKDVTVVFADNSPGFVWQDDFYETEREPGRKYGVYYHHQLWGSGPHLVQAVPPSKTYEMFKLAYDHDAHHYAIMNVSNIREFILGIDASSSILKDINAFDPVKFLKDWCIKRYGSAASNAVLEAYNMFFESYQIHPNAQSPYTLDGQMRSYGVRQLLEIEQFNHDPKGFWGNKKSQKEKSEEQSWGSKHLSDMHPEMGLQPESYLSVVEKQMKGLEQCKQMIPDIKQQLMGDTRTFFESNYEAQVEILSGITGWLIHIIKGNIAIQDGDKSACLFHLQKANKALEDVRTGKVLASRGKWEHWYRGDKKMNMPQIELQTKEILNQVRMSINQ